MQPRDAKTTYACARGSLARDLGSLTNTRVVCHVLVCNLADNLVRALLHYRSTRAGVVLRRSVPLDVNLPIAFDVVDASDAASTSEIASAARNQNAATAEAIVASLSIDQHDVPRSRFILQTEAEHCDREATSSRFAGSIRCRAGHSGCAYRESLARCHDLVVLVLADHCDAGAVVRSRDREVDRPATT